MIFLSLNTSGPLWYTISYSVYHIVNLPNQKYSWLYSAPIIQTTIQFFDVLFSDFVQLLLNYDDIHVDGMTAENALAHNNVELSYEIFGW